MISTAPPGHMSKFNGLLYLVRQSLLNPHGGRANDNCRRDCNCEGNCDDVNVYGDDGGTGAMTTKVKKDNKGRSLMRQRADDIANEIIKALVESIDKGGHGPVLPLIMTVSVGSEYGRH